MIKYPRILLKLSGESLMGNEKFGYNQDTVEKIVKEIKKVHALGCEIAIVIGGGNICRGKSLANHGVNLVTADYMGMMGTVMNGLYLQDVLKHNDLDSRVMTAIGINQVAEPFIRLKAVKHLSRSRIVILSGGTGNPFCTTDTAASLRAKELDCDIIIKATKVDGIYDKDPNKYQNAVKYNELTFSSAIEKKLEVMDMTAFTMCKDFNLPIIVCNILGENNLENIVKGEKIGTLVKN